MTKQVFFRSGPDTRYDAHLWLGPNPHYPYTAGYLQAADILVDYFIEHGGIHRSTLIYPVVFNYRQYIELKLKEIILRGREFIEEDEEKKDWQHHQLGRLWDQAKVVIDKMGGSVDFPEFEGIDMVVKEFDELDLKADAFRFHQDKNGELHLQKIDSINLLHMKNQMENISNGLEAIEESITQNLDAKYTVET